MHSHPCGQILQDDQEWPVDVDWLTRMELTRGDAYGVGSLRYRGGKASNSTLMALGVPLSISKYAPKRTDLAWRSPTSTMWIEVHVIKFNGVDGTPRIHPDAAVQMDGFPTRELVRRTRSMLQQNRPEHPLCAHGHGWCSLPESVYSLPPDQAVPDQL